MHTLYCYLGSRLWPAVTNQSLLAPSSLSNKAETCNEIQILFHNLVRITCSHNLKKAPAFDAPTAQEASSLLLGRDARWGYHIVQCLRADAICCLLGLHHYMVMLPSHRELMITADVTRRFCRQLELSLMTRVLQYIIQHIISGRNFFIQKTVNKEVSHNFPRSLSSVLEFFCSNSRKPKSVFINRNKIQKQHI